MVIDDGCGMNHDDALLAFERHATSKLRTADDLLSIATLGISWRALPTIAAVSRLLLETRERKKGRERASNSRWQTAEREARGTYRWGLRSAWRIFLCCCPRGAIS